MQVTAFHYVYERQNNSQLHADKINGIKMRTKVPITRSTTKRGLMLC